MTQDADRSVSVPRVFCIGRNYVEHAREMKSELPTAPVIFLKPASCLVPVGQAVHFPRHGRELHHEAELVVRIGRAGRDVPKSEALSLVDGVTLGLDLTMRDVQAELKQKGLPWEKAKAFDESAPIGAFTAYGPSLDLHDVVFTCRVNGEVRQEGRTRDMIFDVETLIAEVSGIWALRPGDLIYTGTPAGVGPLAVGDRVAVASEKLGGFSWEIVASG